jgi:hypothetical protein
VAWPPEPGVWYTNIFLQLTAGNIVFALFTEGALKIMDKLSNPMSVEDSSFSERVFGECWLSLFWYFSNVFADSFMFNNCQAMKSAFTSYDDLDEEPLLKVAETPLRH